VIQIKIPSKTFLVGEYVALNEGSALLLNTSPEFSYTIEETKGSENRNIFHKNSPSGKFYSQNIDLFNKYNFTFDDPHHEKGGFGASGARFSGLVAFKKILDKKPLFNSMDFREKLFFYSDAKQSGYDVISQFNGQVCSINIKNKSIEPLDWAFEDIAVTIVRTGNNIKTHEHLKNVKLKDLSQLEKISANAVQSFKSKDKANFFDYVNLYYEELINLNLVCEESRHLVSKIKKKTTCFHAVKACGAAGADTILAIHDINDTKRVKKYFKSCSLDVVFSGNKFSSGMSIDTSSIDSKEGSL